MSSTTDQAQRSSMISSFLDTDLYKLTMQNAVFQLYRNLPCTYRFTNRNHSSQLFSPACFKLFRQNVLELSSLRLGSEERTFLTRLGFLPEDYLDWLEDLRLRPEEQVEMRWIKDEERSKEEGKEVGVIEVDIKGLWVECILYEVPIMAILSESYFLVDDTDWKQDDFAVQTLAKSKATKLLQHGVPFSEFGTRRRRSLAVQENVLKGLIEGNEESKRVGGGGGGFVGTSNVFFAMKYNLRPVGTIAHEWIMSVAALNDYDKPNGRAMDQWEKVYPSKTGSTLHTMLSDTYTLQLFLQEFTSDPARAKRWTSLRHDSGDPMEFAKEVKAAWEKIDGPRKEEEEVVRRRVIFSDGLDVDRAIELREKCDELGLDASFGIGTTFTNDFHLASSPSIPSRPLNIVIKISSIDGIPTVKLSDDRGKWTGEEAEVRRCVERLGLGSLYGM